jgi:hypothetical protein
MDFFTVPTLRFQILYIIVILNHSRRQVVHFAVTAHPTMAWVIQQLREAMPFGQQPTYVFRDNDRIYGYFAYYQRSRTHLALGKDAPEPRAVEPPEQGRVVAIPQVGGLHHRYQRRAA